MVRADGILGAGPLPWGPTGGRSWSQVDSQPQDRTEAPLVADARGLGLRLHADSKGRP